MKKNVIVIVIVLLLVLAGALSFIAFNKKEDAPIFIANVDLSKIRPEVKTYIDELYNIEIGIVEHSTDSMVEIEKRMPDDPTTFAAGRFKAVFDDPRFKKSDQKVLIFQTEEKVGHYATVTPGETDVDGYVEIQKNPKGDDRTNLKLNDSELDYLIKMLYKKFEKPMDDTQATYLNNLKDYALAIMFSEKKGITEYHNQLIDELKK